MGCYIYMYVSVWKSENRITFFDIFLNLFTYFVYIWTLDHSLLVRIVMGSFITSFFFRFGHIRFEFYFHSNHFKIIIANQMICLSVFYCRTYYCSIYTAFVYISVHYIYNFISLVNTRLLYINRVQWILARILFYKSVLY